MIHPAPSSYVHCNTYTDIVALPARIIQYFPNRFHFSEEGWWFTDFTTEELLHQIRGAFVIQ